MIKKLCYMMPVVFALSLFGCSDKEQSDITKAKTTESIVTTETAELFTTALPVTTVLFVETSAPNTTEVTTVLPEPTETTTSEITEVPDEPQNNIAAEVSYDAFLNLLVENECELGVADLGTFDGGYEDIMTYLEELGLLTRYPFLKYIAEEEYIDLDGSRLYLFVPAIKESFTVCETAFDETDSITIKECYTSDNAKAILVLGNINETVTDIIIKYKSISGDALEYNPAHGEIYKNLVECEGIFDFSPYLEKNEYIMASVLTFCDEWVAEVYDDNGKQYSLGLSLALDSTAMYTYSVADSEEPSFFCGEWTLDESNVLTIDLVSEDEDTYSSRFEWKTLGDTLLLKPLSGDEILFERYVAPVVNEEELSGCYSAISEDKAVYLELSWEKSAVFTVEDYPDILEKYKGSWCVEDGYLYLSLTLEGGANYSPEEPTKFIKGCYYIDSETEADLKLSCIYGDALTINMQNSVEEEFWYYQHV